MCLGSQARAANTAAKRQYQYQIERREREWMQQLSVYGAKRVQYDVNTDNARMAAQAAYAEHEYQRREARGQAELQYEKLYAEMLENSEAATAAASGQTGQSIRRMKTLEAGAYGRQVANVAHQLVSNDRLIALESSKARGQAKAYIDNAFAEVAFQPVPDVAPPPPVLQNVGQAAFMDALKIGSSVASIALPFVVD